MHSDEKADVNELLVQLDRASQLGRMVVCTTNDLSSLDEAVLRSGRFGNFIPVPPPDEEAAAGVAAYYLARLGKDPSGRTIEEVHVEVPGVEAVKEVTRKAFAQARSGAFCGADIEVAVNSLYRRALRCAMSASAGKARYEVRIDARVFLDALLRAPRSVSGEALERFRAEVERFATIDRISASDSTVEAR